ncbi:hypothetical protein NE237_021593 [Protea cynaroides]|uniref:Uncharacterized protein n=1 Tax=Protea cynaroides TaxID=273540 RepID=A0A9Q0K508_9MAGN|nr:hypothetical protein NE237_021593 [Protea cynaroides]
MGRQAGRTGTVEEVPRRAAASRKQHFLYCGGDTRKSARDSDYQIEFQSRYTMETSPDLRQKDSISPPSCFGETPVPNMTVLLSIRMKGSCPRYSYIAVTAHELVSFLPLSRSFLLLGLSSMEVLRRIPTDGTFNQTAPLARSSRFFHLFSFDLSTATDGFPLPFQETVVKSLFGGYLRKLRFDPPPGWEASTSVLLPFLPLPPLWGFLKLLS